MSLPRPPFRNGCSLSLVISRASMKSSPSRPLIVEPVSRLGAGQEHAGGESEHVVAGGARLRADRLRVLGSGDDHVVDLQIRRTQVDDDRGRVGPAEIVDEDLVGSRRGAEVDDLEPDEFGLHAEIGLELGAVEPAPRPRSCRRRSSWGRGCGPARRRRPSCPSRRHCGSTRSGPRRRRPRRRRCRHCRAGCRRPGPPRSVSLALPPVSWSCFSLPSSVSPISVPTLPTAVSLSVPPPA